jgi:NAD+ synthase
MIDRLRLALAQLNPVLGDLTGNIERIRQARAAANNADIVVTPELSVCGYPPEDLVQKPFFVARVRAAVETLAAETADGGPALIVGAPWVDDDAAEKPYNAALVLDQGHVIATVFKVELPNYRVFDEKRVFAAGTPPGPVHVRGVRLGLMVCEDMWFPEVTETLEETGAELLMVPNGSPFERAKRDERLSYAVARVRESGLPLVYVNQVGGQDELTFDGASFVVNADFTAPVNLPAWQSVITMTEWTRGEDGGWACAARAPEREEDSHEDLYRASVIGLGDYVRKNRFPGVLIGLSGGIDSALTLAMAVDALGADQVRAVMMPSPYTSQESLDDATDCARRLGVRLDEIGIGPAMTAFDGLLTPVLDGAAMSDITAQNIQSRSRGLALMALSNQTGAMLLTTGNKSEMAVGYATLYGDMCGGYNALKDLYKTEVFALSRWRNGAVPTDGLGPAGVVIPERIITKPPSAELKPGQTDQDSLPPYEVLDDILFCLVEQELGLDEILARGHDHATVDKVWRLLDRSEYKRRQAPPGAKISRRAFGKERRYPMTNRFVSVLG